MKRVWQRFYPSRGKPFSATTLALVSVVILLGLLGCSLYSLSLFRGAQLSARHSDEVRVSLGKLRIKTLELKHQYHDFLLTGTADAESNFDKTKVLLLKALERFADLTKDNPSQQSHTGALAALLRTRFAEMSRAMDGRRPLVDEQAIADFAQQQLRQSEQGIGELIDQMDLEEVRLLRLRIAEAERMYYVLGGVVLLSNFVLLLLGGLIRAIYLDLRRREVLHESLSASLQREKTSGEFETRRARQASMIAEVALALTKNESIPQVVQRACEAAIEHLDAAFARVWTLSADGKFLELQASAGLNTHLDGGHRRVAVGQLKIGLIAAEKQPQISNDLETDPRIGDIAWAREEGLHSFAGYPILVEDRLVGVFAMFGRDQLPSDLLDTMGAVANTLAIGIERKRIDAAIRESEERYRFLADAIPDQVWTATPTGEIDYVNRRVLDYFGKSAEEMIGAGWLSALHPDDVAGCLERWTHSLQTGEPYQFEFRLHCAADGSYRTHIARALPLRGEHGEIVKWFGTNSDISERQAAERERDRLIRALKRSNEALDQFAYVASHDLKAPLRGIANLSQWMEEDLGDKLTGESLEHMRLLRGRVRRMEALIDGILNYSRAARTAHEEETVEVRALIQEVIGLLLPAAGVTILICSEMPTLMTERIPLQQVFLNLIGNAIKHAQRSDPHIEVSFSMSGALHHFTVSDNGQGIAAEYHERIWRIFQTIETKEQVEGTGIGLFVVKKVVENRGGKAWVESTLGHGSTFHFLWSEHGQAEDKD